MTILLITFLIDVLIGSAFLWLGMLIVARFIDGMPAGGRYCSFWQVFLACVAAAAGSFVPQIGWLVGWAVLFGSLIWLTEAGFFRVLLMVAISRFASLLAALFLLPIFST